MKMEFQQKTLYRNLFENYLAKEGSSSSSTTTHDIDQQAVAAAAAVLDKKLEEETLLSLSMQYYYLLDQQKQQQQQQQLQLPLIDLSRLNSGDLDKEEECKREIIEASKDWGFFQVINHGISSEILDKMFDEQVKAFRQPFDVKANHKISNFSSIISDSYRWGTPTPTPTPTPETGAANEHKRVDQYFSWSEAFHIPMANIYHKPPPATTHDDDDDDDDDDQFNTTSTTLTLRFAIEEFGTTVLSLAQKIAEILGENLLGYKSPFFEENCSSETSYLRLNRYPPCPISTTGSGVDHVFGLMPHTDSDFLTILYQDEVGGLQLVKDGRWITVKPNPQALIVNIGDLFQAWSNGIYKSVEHRVLTNKQVERFSTAYFLCPSYDSVIQSCGEPPMYREFSFREFRNQVQEDVKTMGYKVGLPRFLL